MSEVTTISGIIEKMHVSNAEKVQYHFNFAPEICVNDLIGKSIRLKWTGKLICAGCGKQVKSVMMGFCFKCGQDAPEAAECILRPELCRAHLGEGRDVEWEQKNHNRPHVVYLTASDVVKVGVTSDRNMQTRWMDQGAVESIVLAETPNRYTAGLIEVALKSHYSDKTNWQRMLKGERDESIDLIDEKGIIEDLLPFDLRDYISDNDEIFTFEYPVENYPQKVKSINLEKTSEYSGKLVGIKGQYLIFEDDSVINLRKYSAFELEFFF
jgi:hypothetical protein